MTLDASQSGQDGFEEPMRRHDFSWSKSSVASWLADHGGKELGAGALFALICEQLAANGIPISRANCALQDTHPQVASRGFLWRLGEGIEESEFLIGQRGSKNYQLSPIWVIHQGASAVRRRLSGPDANLDFPVLHELKARGVTDYIAMPLVFSDNSRHFISFATDHEGGFSVEHLTHLNDLMPLICLRLELDHSHMVTRTFLNTYMGERASKRIIGGTIRRNQGEAIDAILLYSDLRQFTKMADMLTPEEVIQILGDFYDAVARPVEEFGGDIIKMMGDGILTIFPYSENSQENAACNAASAARQALAGLHKIKPERLPEGIDSVRAGFALHAGQVTFGNVGSTSRLDFTVIGPAVNEVVRVETLTKTLGHSILTTSAFADLKCVQGLMSLGSHALRGVREPKEIFTVMEI